MPSFVQIGEIGLEEFEKVGFRHFASKKKKVGGKGRGHGIRRS